MSLRITRKRFVIGVISILGITLVSAELFFLSPSVRCAFVSGAERVGADGFLTSRLSDRDLKVRTDAGDALIRRGAKAVPALVAMLDDEGPGNRGIAASTLARIGPAAVEAIPALTKVAIEDDDEGVQEKAGQSLGMVARDHHKNVLELLAMLEASSDAQKLAAIRAAAWLDDARAVPPLIGSLTHANPKVREEAAEALGQLKALAIPALPILIELVSDPIPEVKSEARQAITKIIKAGGIDPKVLAQAKAAVGE